MWRLKDYLGIVEISQILLKLVENKSVIISIFCEFYFLND
jgi:hypothetical protein